jgi:hypothetical protein
VLLVAIGLKPGERRLVLTLAKKMLPGGNRPAAAA